jgi:predicted Zn-dependent peptidase
MIKNLNNDARRELANVLEECKESIEYEIDRARHAIAKNWRARYDNADAYIFRQLKESCDNANPYNQSLQSLIDELGGYLGDDRMEPIEEFGEEWEDE